MDKNIYDKHANLMFFGNFVFADTELSDLGAFLRDINTWIQPLSATLGFEELRRGFESETFSRTVIEPAFDL